MDHQTKSTLNQLRRIKILNPAAPNRSTGLINGESSGILNWNDVAYPSFYRTYKELSTNFWIPDEVDMKGDVQDYRELSAKEKAAYDYTIGLLATLDSPQTRFMSNASEYLTDMSAMTDTIIIAQQEAIHNESYSYVLSSITGLEDQKRIFDAARNHPIIQQRNQPIMDAYEDFIVNKSVESLIKALVNSLVLESLAFYQSFALFYGFSRQNRLGGTAKIISFINRDELVHTKFVSELLRGVLGENPTFNNEALTDYVHKSFTHAVEMESKWMQEIYNGVDWIDFEEMLGYVKYRANTSAGMLGLPNIYPDVNMENTMPWIKAYVDNFTETKTDFFEFGNAGASYKKVNGDNGFDDL